MDCSETRDLLVALDDGELGRSEETLVLEHLARCPSCRGRRDRLTAATPRATGGPPPQVRARLAALDGASLLAQAELAPPKPAPVRPWRLELTPAMALAYAFLLAAVAAWGLTNWRERAALEERVAAQAQPQGPSSEIPAAEYRPAAWAPPADPDAAPVEH